MHYPMDLQKLNVSLGWAMGAPYDFMKGTSNELALKHIPTVDPRNDTIAGPKGRRGDWTGPPYLMHK
jgi:hypothetical protein